MSQLFFNDILFLKIGRMVFVLKLELVQRVKKFPKRLKKYIKWKNAIPYIFINLFF